MLLGLELRPQQFDENPLFFVLLLVVLFIFSSHMSQRVLTYLDLNRAPQNHTAVLQLEFVCRPKSDLREAYIRALGEERYRAAVESPAPIVIPKISRTGGRLLIYIFS